jgi:predicted nucleotidyltransferase
MNLDQSILAEMIQRLVTVFAPEQVILFGSNAWGTPTADSDVDLCVIVLESSKPPRARNLKARKALSIRSHKIVYIHETIRNAINKIGCHSECQ